MGLPFWSRPVAVSCTLPPAVTDAGFGVTVIDVSTGGGAVPRENSCQNVQPSFGLSASTMSPEVASTGTLADDVFHVPPPDGRIDCWIGENVPGESIDVVLYWTPLLCHMIQSF